MNTKKLTFGIMIIIPICIIMIISGASGTIQIEQGSKTIVYAPADNELLWPHGIGYPRVIELQYSGEANGTLLATCEYSSSGLQATPVGYPIFRSTDKGANWSQIGKASSKMRIAGTEIQSEFQPFIYELPRKIGDMPAGTLLLSGCLVDAGHAKASALVIYRSYDHGATWEQYSTIVIGGGISGPSSGVWEPFLMMLDDGSLICYYSDSTDWENHSQELSYRISADGVNWGETVKIVSLEDRTLRPGMSVICRLDDGRYFMTYEMCDEDNLDCGNKVTCKYSNDGLHWGNITDPGTTLITTDGKIPGSAPYCAYIPNIGDNGVIVVAACFQSPGAPSSIGTYLYVSLDNGETWEKWKQPLPYPRGKGGYSSGMFLSSDKRTLYLTNCNENPESTKDYFKFDFTTLKFFDSNESLSSVSSASSDSQASSIVVSSVAESSEIESDSNEESRNESSEIESESGLSENPEVSSQSDDPRISVVSSNDQISSSPEDIEEGNSKTLIILISAICLVIIGGLVYFMLRRMKRNR